MDKKQKKLEKVIKKYEEALKVAIYEAVDIKELEKIEQDIKNCNDNLRTLVDKTMMLYFDIRNSQKKTSFYTDRDKGIAIRSSFNTEEYEIFEQNLKNDYKLKRRISDAINNCRKYLKEFQSFCDTVDRCMSYDYNSSATNYELVSHLPKLDDGILSIKKNAGSRRGFVQQFTTILKNYLHHTKHTLLNDDEKKHWYDIITELQDICPKYPRRYDDLRNFYEKVYSKIIENRFTKLPYLSQKYHKKYFQKACICLFVAFIWFMITSPMQINFPVRIFGEININFKPTLDVSNEWLKYIIWITIKTPSIILAWIGLSYLRSADRHDQDAKELSNLYQYKSMITDPVTQDALMVALAPNYFGTKRNRRSDNNFMEKLLLKMIPTLNINAGGGSNNGNNGGQNGGQTHG